MNYTILGLDRIKLLHSSTNGTLIYELIFMKIYMKANIMNTQIFIQLSMTSEVIEGHIRSLLCFKIHFLSDIFSSKIRSYQNFV